MWMIGVQLTPMLSVQMLQQMRTSCYRVNNNVYVLKALAGRCCMAPQSPATSTVAMMQSVGRPVAVQELYKQSLHRRLSDAQAV